MYRDSAQGPWWQKNIKKELTNLLSSFLKPYQKLISCCEFVYTVLSSQGVQSYVLQSCLHAQITCCCTLVMSKYSRILNSMCICFSPHVIFAYWSKAPAIGGGWVLIKNLVLYACFSVSDNMLLYFNPVNFSSFCEFVALRQHGNIDFCL